MMRRGTKRFTGVMVLVVLSLGLVVGCQVESAENASSQNSSNPDTNNQVAQAQWTSAPSESSTNREADELASAPLLFNYLLTEEVELTTPSPPPTILDAQAVQININALIGGHDQIILNLNDGPSMVMLRDSLSETQSGGFIWSGHLQDQAKTQVMLSVNNSVVQGTINLAPHQYQIQFVRDSVHALYLIDPNSFPED